MPPRIYKPDDEPEVRPLPSAGIPGDAIRYAQGAAEMMRWAGALYSLLSEIATRRLEGSPIPSALASAALLGVMPELSDVAQQMKRMGGTASEYLAMMGRPIKGPPAPKKGE